MYKYLYEKDYKDENIERKIFSNEDSLLKYMLDNKKNCLMLDLKMQKLDY